MAEAMSLAQTAARMATFLLIFAALLFIPAGTLNWPEAWLFLAIYLAWGIPVVTWLRKNNPELLKKRLDILRVPPKSWDKAFLVLALAAFIGMFAVMGLGVRYNWPQLSPAVKALGFAGIVIAFPIMFWVLRENTYLSRVVEIQKGHRVITTGPYRHVRHPLYASAIALYASIPVAMGSFYALCLSLSIALLVIVRTYLEDKMLQKELPGYREYTKKTRYRLVPWIW